MQQASEQLNSAYGHNITDLCSKSKDMENQRTNGFDNQRCQDEEVGFAKITAIATKQVSISLSSGMSLKLNILNDESPTELISWRPKEADLKLMNCDPLSI